MKDKNTRPVTYAILAAILYALSTPVSKILMTQIPPSFLAGLLYLGAGFGILPISLVKKRGSAFRNIDKKDLPYIIGMIILDIAAPVFLMIALSGRAAANISLINNFEIVATSLIAFVLFRERISGKLCCGITLITVSSLLLSFEGMESLSFSTYSAFAFLACISWGFENNCTRKLSDCDPSRIVVIKGIGSGTGALLVSHILQEEIRLSIYVVAALVLGFFAYGLSVYFYISAQRTLGAAKTSSYYAIAPFIGALLSIVLLRELPGVSFIVAFVAMIGGMVLVTTDSYLHPQS
ncbi:MAG: DMT family transporter [Clostridiales bacterium]|nr:DMT family transporter [Clostridiales bacterium]